MSRRICATAFWQYGTLSRATSLAAERASAGANGCKARTAVTRKAKWYEGTLHPEEALTREQAIRFYTMNNAYLLFKEHNLGSLEPGKLADFIVLDTDLLACPIDDIKNAQVLKTYVDGKLIFRRE